MNYIDKDELNRAVRESQRAGRVTDELARLVALVVRKYVGKVSNDCDRDDVAQQVFVIVARKLNRLDPDGNVFGYLTTVIRNEVFQQHERRRKFDRLRLDLWRSQSHSPDPDHDERA